ncbi:hypothetical protein [Nocardiopsis sp. NRRL B-16309]|uniref:hypothetical protein n=1 Tax=Nocardiopsis sp. NRRL B-16309 TaxID=1519494 RepID=UPI0006AF30D4|nr:hypothetical protein [Nocardiopsis sp. NRRL B-16309]KOX16476.1 hypothetical protein ADL05_12205 [Nocardiopsis sp. NRRL B-16309]
MQRTSRTPRATRVASAPCSGTPSPLPSLLWLGLLVGAALAALWLLGGAPAHADSGRGAAGALSASGPDGAAPLGGVVPGEVAEPVSSTLGTVHQRLQSDPDRRPEPGGALTGAARPVADVGAEVIGAVGEADEALPGTDDLAAVPVLPLDEPHRPGGNAGTTGSGDAGRGADPADSPSAPDDGGSDRAEAADAPAERPAAPADSIVLSAAPADHAPAAGTGDGRQDADPAPLPQEPPVGQSAAASAATTGSSPAPTPGIAGYLSSAPLTAPGSDALRPAPRHHRVAPAAGTDDPTVSPD